MGKEINIGILGCADIARRSVIPNMISSGKYNIVAHASRTADKAIKFSQLFGGEAIVGYDVLLNRENIDSVYIPLPTGLHYKWIIKALNNGKHVFSEKSITTNYLETKEIIDLAREKDLCVFENFMFVYHSQYDFVKQKISDGEIGEIKLLRSSFGFPLFSQDNNIRYKDDLGGGALLDAGAYTLMAAQFILGKNQNPIASSLEKCGQDVDFQGSVMLKNPDGIVSQLAFGFDNYYQNNIELWGNKGKMVIDRAFTAGPGFGPKVIIEKQNDRKEYILPADNHFQKILKAFSDSVSSGKYDSQYEQILNQSYLLTAVRKLNSEK